MRYHVARNGQVYGPYTLDELQRYMASGHILPTDSAKSDEMTDWVPVTQIAGGAAAPIPGAASSSTESPAAGYPAGPAFNAPVYGAPQVYGVAAGLPGPPDLHWGLVLLFDLLTCSLFQLIWNLVLAAWFRRVYPPTKVLLLYAASAVLIFAQGAFGQTLGFMAGRHGIHTAHGKGLAGYGFVALLCWVVRLVARFSFRADLEQHYNTTEPMGLEINPVLTFFFGGVYLQSVLNRVNAIKRGVAFGGFPR